LATSTNLASPYYVFQAVRPGPDVAIYVDFDGVLQHEAVLWSPRRGPFMCPREAAGRTLFEWVHFLEESLEDFPDAKLVLSSTWCIRPGYSKAIKCLPAKLRGRFVGGTFHKRMHGADPWILQSFQATPRWRQILADVERRQPRAWLALDDDIGDWPQELRANLVACEGSTGLSSPYVRDELRQKLSKALQK
jgi:HAD domain in Swiss Army Knife RNA repair proteins